MIPVMKAAIHHYHNVSGRKNGVCISVCQLVATVLTDSQKW